MWIALLLWPFVGLPILQGEEPPQELSARTRGAEMDAVGPPTIFTVNTTADTPDADQLDGLCRTANGDCSLRAAVMQADYSGGYTLIMLPAGTYTLTRVHYDDDAVAGDLDISANITVQGAGSAVTIIDGNGPVTHDRVFQVLSTSQNFTLTGITIRNGESLNSNGGILGGGGLYIEGAPFVYLSDVIFDSNTGQNGGAIYANFSSMGGSLEMHNVIMRSNTAMNSGLGQGGGAFVRLPASTSQFLMQDSQVYSNTADGTGGGVYVDGNSGVQWTIQRTVIYSNTGNSGGGIGNFIPLTLSDSIVHDNHAAFDGGAIEAYAPMIILRTTIANNSAARFAGGIFNLQSSPYPGYTDFCHIETSTLSGNFGLYGGAIYHDGFITPSSLLNLINTTITSNAVSKNGNGGGLYAYGGQVQLTNSTVANNRVVLGLPSSLGTGKGGGLFLRGGVNPTDSFVAENSIIANNARGNGIQPDTADDGFTTTDGTNAGAVNGNLGFNLIRTLTNFFINGPQGGNINGQDPLLGPLQDNGGPTYTLELLSGSPAINTGTDAVLNSPTSLTIDQRGYPRKINTHVDMGAFEYEFGGRLRIISITRSGSNVLVTFQALQGATYRLVRKLAITDPTWQTIPGVADLTAPITGQAQITDPNAISLGKAFYQVQLLH